LFVSDSKTNHEPLILLLATAVCVAISGIQPHDTFTWWLEVLPVFLAAPVLVLTYHRFRLTALVYRLIFIHAVILIIGAHYTYALVPLGNWAKELFDLSRNHYDRIGHLAQGFFPAILVREILLRCSPLRPGKWLFFIVVSVCLAFSAFYELTEWWIAVFGGEATTDFLGTQGDVWDTQWDMFLALIGAVAAQTLLSRAHDRALAKCPRDSR
jgi:putative membrane protein